MRVNTYARTRPTTFSFSPSSTSSSFCTLISSFAPSEARGVAPAAERRFTRAALRSVAAVVADEEGVALPPMVGSMDTRRPLVVAGVAAADLDAVEEEVRPGPAGVEGIVVRVLVALEEARAAAEEERRIAEMVEADVVEVMLAPPMADERRERVTIVGDSSVSIEGRRGGARDEVEYRGRELRVVLMEGVAPPCFSLGVGAVVVVLRPNPSGSDAWSDGRVVTLREDLGRDGRLTR